MHIELVYNDVWVCRMYSYAASRAKVSGLAATCGFLLQSEPFECCIYMSRVRISSDAVQIAFHSPPIAAIVRVDTS